MANALSSFPRTEQARHPCHRPPRAALIASSLIAGSLAACSPAAPYLRTGDDLAHSGFTAHVADTTARYAMLNLLPAGMLTYRPTTTGPVYLYADRLGCGCVYMGSASAFIDYTRTHPAPAQTTMTAEINQHPGWDWSVWSNSADPGPNQPKHVIGAEW